MKSAVRKSKRPAADEFGNARHGRVIAHEPLDTIDKCHTIERFSRPRAFLDKEVKLATLEMAPGQNSANAQNDLLTTSAARVGMDQC